MKSMKKLMAAGAVIAVIGATSVTAFAWSGTATPAEIAAGLTGRTIESVTDERTETGKTYGTIAAEAGMLDEWKTQILEQRELYLEEAVASGAMTQEEADAILAAAEARQADCDGTGSGAGLCTGDGTGFGTMNGNRGGQGGLGVCDGQGTMNGQGVRNGQSARGARGAMSGQGVCTGCTAA